MGFACGLCPSPPISRILSYRPLAGTTGPSSLWTTHCCGPQAAYLRISGPPHLRVLALLRVGLAKPRHHCRAGEPLPRLFTLAGACAPAVCFLLRFPSHHCAWPLTSTLPCGVRTFLRRRGFPPRPRRSGELGHRSLSFTVLKFPRTADKTAFRGDILRPGVRRGGGYRLERRFCQRFEGILAP